MDGEAELARGLGDGRRARRAARRARRRCDACSRARRCSPAAGRRRSRTASRSWSGVIRPRSPGSGCATSPEWTAGPPASKTSTCVRSSAISSPPRSLWQKSAIWFAIVAVGRKSASSWPSSSAARRWSSLTVGSSRSCSSPTSAAAIAARISAVGFVAVSERRSITRAILAARWISPCSRGRSPRAASPRTAPRQVWDWAARGAPGYDAMTNVPPRCGRRSRRTCRSRRSTVETEARSQDGTVKALFRTDDGHPVEAVLMTYRDGRRSLCLSSQSGCPLTCTFCATGQMRFRRNLTASEILDQALHFRRLEPVTTPSSWAWASRCSTSTTCSAPRGGCRTSASPTGGRPSRRSAGCPASAASSTR